MTMEGVIESQSASTTDTVFKTEDKAEHPTKTVRNKTIEVISLVSPEPEPESRSTRDETESHERMSKSVISLRPKQGIKRESNQVAEAALIKRPRGPDASSSREEPFIAAINAAIEQYREEDAAEKQKLQAEIERMEMQLEKSQDEISRLQAHTSASKVATTVAAVKPQGKPSVIEQLAIRDPGPDVDLLTQSVADLTAKISRLEEALCEKDMKLSTKNEEIIRTREILRTKDSDLSNQTRMNRAQSEEVRNSDARVVLMAEDLRAMKELWREADSARRASEAAKQQAAELLKSKDEQILQLLEQIESQAMETKKQKQRLSDTIDSYQKSSNELQETIRRDSNTISTLQDIIRSRNNRADELKGELQSLRQAVGARNNTINDLQKRLRVFDDILQNTKAELHLECAKVGDLMASNHDIQTQKDVWKTRATHMFSEYQETHEKNTTMVEKVKAMMELCTPGSISKKNRKMLDDLSSRPLEELEAYQKD